MLGMGHIQHMADTSWNLPESGCLPRFQIFTCVGSDGDCKEGQGWMGVSALYSAVNGGCFSSWWPRGSASMPCLGTNRLSSWKRLAPPGNLQNQARLQEKRGIVSLLSPFIYHAPLSHSHYALKTLHFFLSIISSVQSQGAVTRFS